MLDEIVGQVTAANPGIVVVDSFRTLVRKAQAHGAGEVEVQTFVQRLAQFLTSWEATTFLIGEYVEDGDPRQSLFHRGRRSLLAVPGAWSETPWCAKCRS